MKTIVFAFCCLAGAIWLHHSNDYMHAKPTNVTVVEKYLSSGGYKSSSRPVLVLRTDDGRVFDHDASFTTYALTHKGQRISLSLRRMDIRQTEKENILYFFAPVLLISAAIAVLAVRGAVYLLTRCD